MKEAKLLLVSIYPLDHQLDNQHEERRLVTFQFQSINADKYYTMKKAEISKFSLIFPPMSL